MSQNMHLAPEQWESSEVRTEWPVGYDILITFEGGISVGLTRYQASRLAAQLQSAITKVITYEVEYDQYVRSDSGLEP